MNIPTVCKNCWEHCKVHRRGLLTIVLATLGLILILATRTTQKSQQTGTGGETKSIERRVLEPSEREPNRAGSRQQPSATAGTGGTNKPAAEDRQSLERNRVKRIGHTDAPYK